MAIGAQVADTGESCRLEFPAWSDWSNAIAGMARREVEWTADIPAYCGRVGFLRGCPALDETRFDAAGVWLVGRAKRFSSQSRGGKRPAARWLIFPKRAWHRSRHCGALSDATDTLDARFDHHPAGLQSSLEAYGMHMHKYAQFRFDPSVNGGRPYCARDFFTKAAFHDLWWPRDLCFRKIFRSPRRGALWRICWR